MSQYNTCELQGICVNMASSADPDYMCVCHPMYTGDDCESLKTNPCLEDPPICQNNGTCSYDWVTYQHTCSCDADYKGENCECELMFSLFKLTLRIWYFSDPKQCMSTSCKNGGTCVEKDDGSFDCECLSMNFIMQFILKIFRLLSRRLLRRDFPLRIR